MHIRGIEVLSDEVVSPMGFLLLRRVTLRNVREDGSRSAPYVADFVVRPKGLDAVVVAIWRRAAAGGVEILLRDGLRVPLVVGRPGESQPIPDGKTYLLFREVVAGIIERPDVGEAGVRQRAVLEIEEEAGYRVDAADVRFLGAATFPTAGTFPEKFWLTAVEVHGDPHLAQPEGDGSPMEEGARLSWMPLDEAIAACVRGELEDTKTELVLRRLRDTFPS